MKGFRIEELANAVSKKKNLHLRDYCFHCINWKTFHKGKLDSCRFLTL